MHSSDGSSRAAIHDPQMAMTLAIGPGVSTRPMASLLALQRAEEPQTVLNITDLVASTWLGQDQGHIDIVISTQALTPPAGWSIQELWQEELRIALPHRAPLLVNREITLEMLDAYQVLSWPSSVTQLVRHPQSSRGDVARGSTASSFELLVTLVAAGYCVGIAPQSRIRQARKRGIASRPLAGGPHRITVELLRTTQNCSPAVERFAERAQRISRSCRELIHPSARTIRLCV